MLALYSFNILAGLFWGSYLSLLGPQLATRDKAMQILCAGQGAMLGVLLGLGLGSKYHYDHLFPIVAGYFSAMGCYFLSEKIIQNKASKNTHLTFLFCLLLALSYCVTAFFPMLETHLSQVYFGDLTTLTNLDCIELIILAIIGFGFFYKNLYTITNRSFEIAIFGNSPKKDFLFELFNLVTLSISIQHVGYLFTMGMLFIPTAVLTYTRFKGFRLHYVLCLLVSALGIGIGFLISLNFPTFPTISVILVTIFILGFLVKLYEYGHSYLKLLSQKNAS
jgi:ABC-type Mn2+/Zn2+ transport system permease subunit